MCELHLDVTFWTKINNMDANIIKIQYLTEHEKTLDDLQGELLHMTNKAQEQEKTLRKDVKSGELKINQLKGERMTLKEELEQSSKQIETLTGELEQIQMKSSKERETLTEELKQAKQRKTESDRQIETLKEELQQSKTESDRQIKTMTEELTQIRLESTKKIETLTEELEQTQRKSATDVETLTEELKQSKTASDRQIETLKGELKQTKQSKAESDSQTETLTEELTQLRKESTKKIETLTEELEQTQLKSATEKDTLKEEIKQTKQSKTESDRQIKTLAEELKQTKQNKAESDSQIETLTEELTQLRIESTKKIETLTEELEQAQLKSATEKETLTEELNQIKQNKAESDRQIETLTEELKQTKQNKAESDSQTESLTEELTQLRIESTKKIETLTEELEQTQLKSATEKETLTEELNQIKQNKAESDRQIETLTEELKQTKQNKAESDSQTETLTEELTQLRIESTKKIETLTEELEQTQLKFATEKETLTEELKQIKHSKAESDKQVKALTEELTQVKRESHTKTEMLTKELEQTTQVLDLTKTDYTNKIEALTTEVNETKQKLLTRAIELETTSKELELTKQTLKETAQDRDNTRTELKKYQLDFAKESKALKEVLNQAKEAIAELKRPVEDKPLADSEETRDDGGAMLAAEFGRLTVAIAEHLTLDQCLRLGKICNIPTSDCDIVLRVSMIESPGIKFLDVLKKRKVINMFDVTNLQKALSMLHLKAVNHDLVVPYQEKIDKEQYERNKAEEIYTWEEIDAFVNFAKDVSAQHQIRDGQTSLTGETEPEYSSRTQAGDESRRSLFESRHYHQLYTEHSIGREGGTIWLTNVSLTVPPDALHESHVIALSVMNESPFPLEREVNTARMTPLIKLEPLGLKFMKSLQLNIPHSALISEPEKHDVIIYSGQIAKNDEDSSDSIRWIEERSISRQLKEKSLTVDIQCLTYLSASLVFSQTSAPPLHIVRAVTFVDAVRNTDDDIILTICFCSDNELEYNTLLSDYKTKLTLEQYSTLQLHRHSERDKDNAGFFSVAVTSVNNTYVPDMEQTVKRFAVSHLCTASRVSHQVRLNKKQDKDRDIVDILLTFSQFHCEPTQISLKARIKDLIISEESEQLLFGSVIPVNKMYEDMVLNVSSSLDTEQCRELASHFQLTSEDTEMITSNQDPGKMLMKTLEERSLVDSQTMIQFFEGLKACHLDETAKLVSEYINKISKLAQEEQKHEGDKNIEETREDTPVSQYLLKKGQLKQIYRGHESLYCSDVSFAAEQWILFHILQQAFQQLNT